jgi:hypothetical protein
VLEGVRGEESIAALCRRERIAESLYYNWSKEFLAAGKKRLAGDTARAATSDEVEVLRNETCDLKEVVAEQAPELKRRSANGDDLQGPLSCRVSTRLPPIAPSLGHSGFPSAMRACRDWEQPRRLCGKVT